VARILSLGPFQNRAGRSPDTQSGTGPVVEGRVACQGDSAMLPDMRALRLGMIVGPAVVLAAVGVTHPHHLTPDTAGYWARLHTLLLPVFPLLGVSLWLLLAGTTGPLEWAARLAVSSRCASARPARH
jgi:hypothetical protein